MRESIETGFLKVGGTSGGTSLEVGGTSRVGMFALGVGATGGVSTVGALLAQAMVIANTKPVTIHLPFVIFPRIGLSIVGFSESDRRIYPEFLYIEFYTMGQPVQIGQTDCRPGLFAGLG